MRELDQEDPMLPCFAEVDEYDTDIHDMPLAHVDTSDFIAEAPTQPIAQVTMAEVVENRDGIPSARSRTRDISDGVPVYVQGERARKITKPIGSRGGIPLVVVR